MRRLPCLIILSLLLLLTSCASAPVTKVSLTRAEQVHYFQSLNHWDLSGILAIRTQNDAVSLHWHWQQQGKNYLINLFGPLGVGNVRITGTPGAVLLETADGKKFHSQDADALLLAQTGWRLPITNLYYWIRTLPAPQVPHQDQFNSQHQLTQITQKNWVIQYDYTDKELFPARMNLQNDSLLIKVRIH